MEVIREDKQGSVEFRTLSTGTTFECFDGHIWLKIKGDSTQNAIRLDIDHSIDGLFAEIAMVTKMRVLLKVLGPE